MFQSHCEMAPDNIRPRGESKCVEDVSVLSLSIAPIPAQRSKAWRSRRRYALRAFFRGMRCTEGPPGIMPSMGMDDGMAMDSKMDGAFCAVTGTDDCDADVANRIRELDARLADKELAMIKAQSEMDAAKTTYQHMQAQFQVAQTKENEEVAAVKQAMVDYEDASAYAEKCEESINSGSEEDFKVLEGANSLDVVYYAAMRLQESRRANTEGEIIQLAISEYGINRTDAIEAIGLWKQLGLLHNAGYGKVVMVGSSEPP